MTDVTWVWFQFALCAGLIGYAGSRLIRYGDALAELTGLSRSWMGLILVATVTSLPELVTGLSAVTLTKAPDMAVGDALGSCVFNLAILAFVDALYRKDPLFTVLSRDHLLPASLGVMLLVSTALLLVLSAQGSIPSVGHVGIGSGVLMVLYAFSVRLLYLTEQRHKPASLPKSANVLQIRRALTGYLLAAAVIVASGIWLPFLGVKLAQVMGWSDSFVGTLFVALTTSVPELATTFAAVRMGALDMAVGNLLGSNLFDVLILAVDDVAFVEGPLLQHVSSIHVVSALTAALMSVALMVALLYRPAARVGRLCSWASLVLVVLYLLNAAYQYWQGQ